jgi:hypothetical protein
VRGQKRKAVLCLLFGGIMLAGCSNDSVVQGEKAPEKVNNVFLMYEEDYTNEDSQSIGDLYRVTEGKEKEKIASRVKDGFFDYINSQDKVLYINEENELYESEIGKDKSKLANDVDSFYGNYENDLVTFQNEDKDLYVISGDNEKEKISSNVTQFDVIGVHIYFLDDDGDFAIYHMKDKQETEIASDVSYFTSLSADDEVAYLDEDAALYYKNAEDKESIKITSNEVSSEEIKKVGSSLVYYNLEDEDSNELDISPIKEGGQSKKIATDIGFYQYEDDYYYYINSDNNLFKKKEDDENSTKLASDVQMFFVKDGNVFYTDEDNKLYTLQNGKEPEKIGSSTSTFDVPPDGDVVYVTDDEDLYVNDKKIASDVKGYHHYFGNLAFSTDDDKLYLMENMGEKKVIVDDLDEYSNAFYQNRVVFSNELSFEDITGVWKATEDGESFYMDIKIDGALTNMLTGEKQLLDEDYADYNLLNASLDDEDVTFSLEDDSLSMTIDEETISFNKSSKADADKYVADVQLEQDKEEISDLIDDYISDFDDAVNYGDGYYIEDYFDPASPMYEQQINFVESTYEKNIREELIDYDINNVERLDDGTYVVKTNETFDIYSTDDYEGTEKSFQNTYKVRSVDGEFLITDIKATEVKSDSL